MLVGYDKILELCTAFVEDNITSDFENVNLGLDFYCYPNTKEIFISVLAIPTAIDGFMENLLDRTDINDISNFTWSFLHEVGHCMTWSYLNERTINHCRNIKRKINRGSIKPTVYYTLADEKMATDWALNFVKKNHRLVQRFDVNILTEITNFYLENEVEIEEIEG